jgi:hypothetical protein
MFIGWMLRWNVRWNSRRLIGWLVGSLLCKLDGLSEDLEVHLAALMEYLRLAASMECPRGKPKVLGLVSTSAISIGTNILYIY